MTTEAVRIESKIRSEIAILTVYYGGVDLRSPALQETLIQQLRQMYREAIDGAGATSKSLIIVISPSIAGSALVRALFETYRIVSAEGGELICANFPENYIETLAAMGVLTLPGFSLANSEDEAVSILTSG